MINTHQCHTVECDDCHENLSPGDEFVAHFDSPDEARRDAVQYYDWTHDGDRDLCEQCTANAACVRDGHQPEVYDNTQREWCKRCGQALRDVVTTPTSGEVL